MQPSTTPVSESVLVVTASVEPVPVVELVPSSVVTLALLVGVVVVASVALPVVALPVAELELAASVVAVEPSSPHPARGEASVTRARKRVRRVKQSTVKRTVGPRSPATIPRTSHDGAPPP